ncbi:MAG: hypothetical protein ACJ8AT_05680 [Hyalangium sp.]|uniref:hypothetical protein n=1 Tax=Hyalangium sp. TaxID=2028555 RepID=UPI00389B025E
MRRLIKELVGPYLALALLWLSASPSNAQTTQLLTGEGFFWSHTASKQNQENAQRILEDGNKLMKQFAYADAEAMYHKSLEYWDHPGTHYNLALALIQMNRPLELYEQLEKALKGGEAALGPQKYQHALFHKQQLENQLARVEFTCDAPGAIVMMNGLPVALANGHYTGLMHPGPVIFSVSAEGYQRREKTVALSAGKIHRLSLKLYKPDELLEYEPRWTPWLSRTVMGVGGALAAGGGLLYWQTRQGYHSFDTHVVDCSRGAVDGGCREPELASRRSRLETLNKVSFGTIAAGGAALVTGTALIFLNRDQVHRLDPDELDRRQGLMVMPVLGRDVNGVVLTLQY